MISLVSFSQETIQDINQLINKKSYNKAQAIVEEYLKKDKSNLDYKELLGDIYAYRKNWDKAIDTYKYLIDKKPNTANLYYKYGGVLALKARSVNKFKALGMLSKIKKAFKTCLSLDSSHIESRWALIELYTSLPSFLGGSKKNALRHAIKLQNISKLEGYLAKGYVYEYDKKPKLAKKYFMLAINQSNKLNGNFDKTFRNALHYQFGKISATYNLHLDQGEKCLKLYLKQHTSKDGVEKAWAYYRLAQIYKLKKDMVLSRKYIDKAIKQMPNIKVFKVFRKSLSNS